MKSSKKDLYGIFDALAKKYGESEEEINEYLDELKSEHIEKVRFSDQLRIIKQQMETANNKFTIATIGEFKAGKSTILNTLLNLRGEAELSCQFQPDTAKAIRIIKKSTDQDFEAEIIYKDNANYNNEKLSWIDAKKYTSQVFLDDNPQLKRKAEQISEVRYYLDLDILDQCNFLDLPGLGVNPKHDRVTIEKSNECDAVFWIVSNTQEVTKDTLQHLQLIKHKMIPIINVWFNSDTGEEVGDFTFEEMKGNLLDNFKSYLGENQIMRYCAKEIEIALDKVYEDEEDIEDAFEENVDDIWGYDAMKERLHDLVYGEGIDLEEEKKNRMIENVFEACSEMNQKLDGTISEITNLKNKLDTEKRTNVLTKRKITTAFNSNQKEIRYVASNAVDTIISKVTEACELFIDAKMSTMKIRVVFKSLTKKGKAALEKEFENEYTVRYLEIDNGGNAPSWLNALMSEYKEDLTSIFETEYGKVGLDYEEIEGDPNRDIILDLKFFDSIGENMTIAFEQQIKDNLPIIVSGILLYIPGNDLIDILFMLGSLTGKSIGNSESKLEKRVDQTKRRARLSVSFQRFKLMDSFKKLGRDYNTKYKEKLIEKLNLNNESIDNLINITEKILNIQVDLEEYYNDCRNSIKDNMA